MKTIFILFLLSGLLTTLPAQDSLLLATLRQHTYSLRLEEGSLRGEGAAVLQTAAQTSQFLLIGEQHSIREVGQFTHALYTLAAPAGFRYLALETDPFIAAKLEELAAGDVAGLAAFDGKYPFAIPFYNNPDDFSFLRATAASGAPGPVFWGLDQVFMAAPTYLFDRLGELANDEADRRLVAAYAGRARDGIRTFLQTGNPDEVILFQLQAEDFRLLYQHFDGDDHGEAYRIINGIETTRQIYGHWFEGRYYANNNERGEWMKQRFAEYYRHAAGLDSLLPRVIFKFGANHMYRGLTPMNIFDIGNTASELAAMNGSRSFHIRFTGIRGAYLDPFRGETAFDNTEDLDPLIREAIGNKAAGKDWILLDLRPLRSLPLNDASGDLKQLIFGFDVLILVPEARAVSALNKG